MVTVTADESYQNRGMKSGNGGDEFIKNHFEFSTDKIFNRQKTIFRGQQIWTFTARSHKHGQQWKVKQSKACAEKRQIFLWQSIWETVASSDCRR